LRAVRAVLGAVHKALRREQESRLKVPANNLYYAAAASMFMLDPLLALFVVTVMAIVLFIPMSADPLRLAPGSRLGLWPLSAGQRRLVRAISPWLNPVTWLVVAFALWRRVSVGLAGVATGVFGIAFLAPWRRGAARSGFLRLAPPFPGALGPLIRKDLRGLASTLDFYCALVPALAAIGYRAAGLLPGDAFLPGTWLVLLAISTPSQTLFGLDGRAGRTRYQLLPLAGWQVLVAKDIAFLMAAVALTAALAPAAGLAGALTALALGRKTAIHENRAQLRWRLQAGASFGPAVVQIIGMLGAASFEHVRGFLVLIPCVAVWAASLWWGGRELDAGALSVS
jgi:hypothetical protein